MAVAAVDSAVVRSVESAVAAVFETGPGIAAMTIVTPAVGGHSERMMHLLQTCRAATAKDPLLLLLLTTSKHRTPS